MMAKIPGARRFVRKPTGTEPVAPTFERPLRAVVERGVHLRFVYGDKDGFYRDEYLTAAAGPLADVLGGERGSPEVSVLSGRLHGFTSVAVQDAVVDDILDWAAAWRSRSPEATGDGATGAPDAGRGR
jgi:hypothetical protein